jgi:excisionase family DNA binding protein
VERGTLHSAPVKQSFAGAFSRLCCETSGNISDVLKGSVMLERKSPESIAKLYGVARSTVNEWIRAGVMPAVNVASPKAKRRRWRISEEDIATFEQRRGNLPPVANVVRKNPRTIVRPSRDYLGGEVQQ